MNRNCLVHRSGFGDPDRAGRERAQVGMYIGNSDESVAYMARADVQ